MQLEKVQEITLQKMINKKLFFIINLFLLGAIIYSFHYYQEVKEIVARKSNSYIIQDKYSPGRGINYIIKYKDIEYTIEAQGHDFKNNSRIELIYSEKYNTFFYPNNSGLQRKYIIGIVILIALFNLIVFKGWHKQK